eukprot:gene5798-6079_t
MIQLYDLSKSMPFARRNPNLTFTDAVSPAALQILLAMSDGNKQPEVIKEHVDVELDAPTGQFMSSDKPSRTTGQKIRYYGIGDYDYLAMCTPSLNPWSKTNHPDDKMKFYGPDEFMPALLTFIMGLQHALAMVGGIITPPVLVGYAARGDPETQQALVSAALIVSGICSLIQIIRFKIPGTNYYIGSGLLSVTGTSFTFLAITRESIAIQMKDGKSFDEAFGAMLGVYMVGTIMEGLISFIPRKYIKKIFPPWMCGLTIFLIGSALIKSGIQAWGGGTFCATTGKPCVDVGDSHLRYAHPSYIGLGFFVLVLTVFLELFGSPFMRSAQVAIALLIGYALAAGTEDVNGDPYTSNSKIDAAPAITFLWVKTFRIGFYSPAILPVLIGFLVSGVESIGDISATGDTSGLDADGDRQAEAIQGGLLADSINSFFAALAMNLPNTTFSQNNGVIALTRVASRMAGLGCAIWLILFGILGKLGAFFTSIPAPVLGGMTTFLFASITVSGIKVMGTKTITRRIRFILSVSLMFGLGVTLFPEWANFLDCSDVTPSDLKGLCQAASLTLTTGYAVGCITALILHGLLPADPTHTPLFEDDTVHYQSQPIDHSIKEGACMIPVKEEPDHNPLFVWFTDQFQKMLACEHRGTC